MSAASRLGLLALLLAATLPSVAAGQVPDTTRADSTAAVGDTTDFSELFLKSREEGRLRVPGYPRLGRPELLPALTRLVFDRDSIEWHNTETVSDLLTKVPGVFLWRGGWIGRPEPVNYQARATGSAEFLVDGVPYLALGPDSLAVDPSLLPLSFFERVEVERMPGLIRVHLFTRRHDRLPPRTRVGVASGDFDIARYIASLEKRSANGFGVVVAAEHLAVPLRSGDQGSYRNTQGWLQLSYVPTGKPIRAVAQVFLNGPKREDVREVRSDGSLGADTLSQGLAGSRTDLQASVLYQPSPEGLGWRALVTAARSAWREDSTALSLGSPDGHIRWVDQSVWQLSGEAGFRTRAASVAASLRHRTRWTPWEARASGALAPPGPFVLAGDLVYLRHDGARTSRWGLVRAGVTLPLGLRATAQARVGSWVAYPTVAADSSVSRKDLGLLAGFDRPRLALEVGYWRTDGFAPERYPLYRAIDTIGPSGPTKWLTVSARVAPLQWFVLDGWYSNPVGSRPEGIPPTHSIVNATIQSRFLPTFRSGIFGLKLQGSMESWGTGVIGRGATGDPIELKGATFFRAMIQFKLGDFVAYYDRVNFQASRLGYLPGLSVLRLASTFGVRWEFSN